MKPVIIICGSTATGKSALAVEIAKLIDGEVISADSRQVYTGLDIGSAKITVPEMEGIPHHLINVAEPNTIFTVADFQKLAQEKIADIHARGKMPIICGGTGMYIDAVIYNTTFPEVIANPGLRKELEKYSAEELFEQLQTLDPDRATEIDSQNPVRLIRAIEIATELGSVPKMKQMDSIYETLFIGLELSKELLQERIITRIQ
jgi:tRNA dimethylallyltransferase